MTLKSRMRNLAFTGMVAGALYGCATTQAVAPPARPEAASATAQERQLTPAERCQREQRSRLQNCIIEHIATTCREDNALNEEAFYQCVSENLVIPRPETPGPARQYGMTVSYGDEIASMRVGRAAVMDVARLEAGAIDERGVMFTYEIERVSAAAPAEKTQVLLATVRFNFDGTSEGEAWKLRDFPVWNLRVESNGDGRARVSFETNDPAVLVRPADGAAAPAQKKK